MSAPWHAALALALVGEQFDLGQQEQPDAALLVAQLAELGWDRDRIDVLAHGTSPWPFPLPDAVRAGLGSAQLFAALREARRLLGLEVLAVWPPSRRTVLDADERRLLADVPPHW